MTGGNGQGLLDGLFSTPALDALLDDRACLQGMLDFEAALAGAQASCGIVPVAAAEVISGQADAADYDLAALAEAVPAAGNVAIPMVKALTARVAAVDAQAARFVHWGATSQDAMDTGLVLQMRRVCALLDTDLCRMCAALADLAERHRRTVMAARTWLQQALPTSFGLKAAGWLDALGRHRRHLRDTAAELAVLQFGGAAGTLASLGTHGFDVAAALAGRLQLQQPALPWHSLRDRLARFASELGVLVGSLGKMAQDVALMGQSEVGEVQEPAAPGRGGSSTMPHKRNPVACAAILAASTRVPGLVATMLAAQPQAHERGLGSWHAEWETLPQIVRLAGGALAHACMLAEGLEVHAGRMRANLDLSQGLIMAEAVSMRLAEAVGRAQAHAWVGAACRDALDSGRSLHEVLADDAGIRRYLDASALNALFEPAGYLGMCDAFIERVLTAYRRRSESNHP